MSERATDGGISLEELQLAGRNHGILLEALRYPITPLGLHYLLSHFDVPLVDPGAWRLAVGGHVARGRSLSLDEIRARPAVELAVTMECAGNGRARLSPRPFSQPWLQEAVGTGRWLGTPLRLLLEEVGLADTAVEIVFRGADHGLDHEVEQDFERSLTVGEALESEAILAYDMNGLPLLPQHGFPLRLVVPGWYGMTNVKWLTAITAVDRPFTGYQQVRSYRLRQEEGDEGIPLTRMLPRALMAPPGIPRFPAGPRAVPAGACLLEGRAWSGWAPVAGVEVSTDGGRSWAGAELEDDVGSRWAWRRWQCGWEASPGDHELLCRARDTAGNAQPLEPEWNLGGYGNNAVQRVSVTVSG